MFPPTSETAPTSEIALEKAIKKIQTRGFISSLRKILAILFLGICKILQVSNIFFPSPLNKSKDSVITNGSSKKNWAIIIAVGVKRSFKLPKGPFLESKRRTHKPKITVGTPVKAFRKFINHFFKMKFFKKINKLKKNPIKKLNRVAVELTTRERTTIWRISI